MAQEYETIEIEVIKFDSVDIIMTSDCPSEGEEIPG